MNRFMLRAFGGTIAFAAVALLPGLAIAQTVPVPPPAIETQPNAQPDLQPVPPTAPLPNRSTDTPGFSQSAPAPQAQTQQPTIACPAGQFASKFSDVTPNDWAYEAVNRVAIGEFRCFPTQS